MATELRLRRGTTDEHGNFIGAEAEATVDTDKNTIVVHDGQTQGGFPLAKEDTVSTYSDLRSEDVSKYTNGYIFYVGGRSSVGDGGEGHFRWDSSDLSTEVANDSNEAIYLAPDSDSTGASGAWVKQSGVIDKDITVAVPSTYSTLQQAVDSLSKYQRMQSVRITLNLESGHSPASGVTVEHGDFGHFAITSTDAEVTLDASFSDIAFVRGNQAIMPTLNCLINANDVATNGYYVNDNSQGKVTVGSGVKNTTGDGSTDSAGVGLFVVGSSQCEATDTIFTGNTRNVRCTSASQLEAPDSDFSGARGASGACVFVSRASVAQITNSDLSGGANYGLQVHESRVTARNVNLDNCSGEAVRAITYADINLGIQSGNHTTIRNGGNKALTILDGSSIHAFQIEISGQTPSAEVVLVADMSHLNAVDSTIVNNGDYGVIANRGANVNLRNASVTGHAVEDLRIAQGGFIYADGTETSGTSASGDYPDTVDTNIGTFNALSENGVIFA